MKKVTTINSDLYEYIFEPLLSYEDESDEISNDEIVADIMEILDEELAEAEAICALDKDKNLYLSRLSVLNTVFKALIPGYRLGLEVVEKDQTILGIYLLED